MKYNLILNPSLKKNWIHFDIDIFEDGNDRAMAHNYSASYGGNPDYPAFRPDVEKDIEEAINENKVNMEHLRGRCYPTDEKFWENINSVKIRNPLYYCLKSKVVWQKEEDETPIYTDKLLQIKTYDKYEQKGAEIAIAECQRERMGDFIEGGEFIEIKRKYIKEYKEVKQKLLNGEIHYNKYHNEIGSIFSRIINPI